MPRRSTAWRMMLAMLLPLLAAASSCGLPSTHAALIRLPVRWCVIEGSKYADNKSAGQQASNVPLFDTLKYANAVWQQANIYFFPAEDAPIPVIGDPDTRYGPVGSLDLSYQNPEAEQAAAACKEAWQALYPADGGPILVVAQSLLRAGEFQGDLAATPPVPRALWVKSKLPGTGAKGDALCGHPRTLTSADVTPEGWSVLSDLIINLPSDYKVAHELGHQLMLAHGNGLDDNHDGFLPPQIGPRRFDEYCDPEGMMAPDYTRVAEDILTPVQGCATTGSLMGRNASCAELQPLQIEQAREVARLIPGAIYPTPTETGDH